MLKKSVLFWMKIVECCLSLSCFILYAIFADGVYMAVMVNGFTDRKRLTIMSIIGIAASGYTFIIVPVLLISYALYKTEIDKQLLLLNVYVTAAGAIVYIVGGGFILNGAVPVEDNGGVTATGVMFVLTGIIYLFDAMNGAFCKCLQ